MKSRFLCSALICTIAGSMLFAGCGSSSDTSENAETAIETEADAPEDMPEGEAPEDAPEKPDGEAPDGEPPAKPDGEAPDGKQPPADDDTADSTDDTASEDAE